MDISKKLLNDIADSIEAGFKCFIHIDTFELVTFPDEDRYPIPITGKKKSGGFKKILINI